MFPLLSDIGSSVLIEAVSLLIKIDPAQAGIEFVLSDVSTIKDDKSSGKKTLASTAGNTISYEDLQKADRKQAEN